MGVGGWESDLKVGGDVRARSNRTITHYYNKEDVKMTTMCYSFYKQYIISFIEKIPIK